MNRKKLILALVACIVLLAGAIACSVFFTQEGGTSLVDSKP